jgi:O-succinylbenzoic acid--CoA ligase
MDALRELHARAGDLIAVALPPGPRWREALATCLDAGAAVLPVDHSLPFTAQHDLVQRARPTGLLDEDGFMRLDGDPAPDDAALVVPTSGTTSTPKLAVLTRAAIEHALRASAEVIGHGSWLCCLPLSHMGGLLVVLRSILLGGSLNIHPGFDVAAFEGADAQYVSLVPTMLHRLLAAGSDIARFRAILVGGAGLDPRLRAAAREAGGNVVRTYGMTETCGGVVYDGCPLNGVRVRIDDDEVQLAGPTLMTGYRFDPASTLRAVTEDGWLRTADAGRIDHNGILHVTGRLDEVIVTGGEKVWPAEVETVLSGCPGVREIAVAGVQDNEWGQRVVAYVVASRPAPTLEDLRAFASDRLPRYKLPKELVLVASLPRTPSGKILRRALTQSRTGEPSAAEAPQAQ